MKKVSKKKIDKIKKDLIKMGKDKDFLDELMKGSVKPKRMFQPMKIQRLIQGAHDRRLCFLTLKHEYKIDFYNGKYCIVRLSGNHANILSRGSKQHAIFALKRLEDTDKLV